MTAYLCCLVISLLLLVSTSRRTCVNFTGTGTVGQPLRPMKMAQISVSEPAMEDIDSDEGTMPMRASRDWGISVRGLFGLRSAGLRFAALGSQNFPEYHQKQFRDDVGETHVNAGGNDAACLKRAEECSDDFHHWCGNPASDAQVAASYEPTMKCQVYHPGACPAAWSQWDAFCYKHFWEKKTWFEAEAFCRQYGEGSHLASIHSRVFWPATTGGLSAWIGYTDLDQDTHYKWSDNTQECLHGLIVLRSRMLPDLVFRFFSSRMVA
eukprot:Skav213963  [mRNA]  locus=scaffold5525:27681:38002:- [translate_table: standard]